jgi:hypothetical protein
VLLALSVLPCCAMPCAGVPTLPWSGDGVMIDYNDCPGGAIPDDVYDKASSQVLQVLA